MEDPIYRELMDYAMRALSRRAHTSFELRKKLRDRPHHQEKYENQILDRLTDLKLIDDDAFLKRAIEQTELRQQGRHKLAQRMQLKGIDPERTYSMWSKMNVNEKQIAQAALKKIEKKLAQLPKVKRYQKRAQYLAGKGFPSDIVFELAKD